MSYDHADRRGYSLGLVDYGAGDEVTSIKGKKGKKGILRSIHVAATETFNSVTTGAQVLVGTAADPNAYAQFEIGDLADTDSVSTDDGTTDTDAIIDKDIPADTQVEVTTVAPTGGTPAGIGLTDIIIDWDW